MKIPSYHAIQDQVSSEIDAAKKDRYSGTMRIVLRWNNGGVSGASVEKEITLNPGEKQIRIYRIA